jgi:hypothetical protein
MNVFILNVDFDRDAFVAALDATPIVRNWLAFLPSCIAFASYHELDTVTTYLQKTLPTHGFLVLPAYPMRTGGLLPAHVWDFINNPKDSGKHPVLPVNTFNSLVSGLPPQPTKPGGIMNALAGYSVGDKDKK